MKRFIIFLIILFGVTESLSAQCIANETKTIDGHYGTMPPEAHVTQSIYVQNSSVLPGQTLNYKAGLNIDIDTNFDADTENSNGWVDMQIEPVAPAKYTIGAWYHTSWYMDWFYADRRDKYLEEVPQNQENQNTRRPQRIADVWNGVRNVSKGNPYYLSKISEMSSSDYRNQRTPLLGFYDLSDQRVIDKQIQMAASKGLGFFGFYNYYNNEGFETGSNRIVKRFKSSSNKNMMKYMIGIFQPWYHNFISPDFFINMKETICNQLAVSDGSTTLDPSYLTSADNIAQPIIAIYPGDVFKYSLLSSNPLFPFNFVANENFNKLSREIREAIFLRFGVYPIILLVSDNDAHGRAAYLMQNAHVDPDPANLSSPYLYDGFIGFQHMMPNHSDSSTPFGISFSGFNESNLLPNNTSPTAENPHLLGNGPYRANVELETNFSGNHPVKYNIPSITAGFDTRPWIPEVDNSNLNYAKYYFKERTPTAFLDILQAYKSFMDARYTSTHNYLMCYSWNEWGEGGILEPSEAHQYGYLQALQDTFCLDNHGISEPEVNSVKTDYQHWKQTITWNNNSSDFGDDPDQDSLPNIVEYALGLDPLVCYRDDDGNSNNNGNCIGVETYNDITKPAYYVPFASGQPAKLKYNRHFSRNDVFYFVEANLNSSQQNDDEWKLYLDTDWGHENDNTYQNQVQTVGDLQMRTHTNTGYEKLRLVIGYIDDSGITHRYFFPPQNSSGYRVSGSGTATSNRTDTEYEGFAMIYPNPSKTGWFNIGLKQETAAVIEVSTPLGQKVSFSMEQQDHMILLDLSRKASGIYLVKINQASTTHIYKVIIDK